MTIKPPRKPWVHKGDGYIYRIGVGAFYVREDGVEGALHILNAYERRLDEIGAVSRKRGDA